MAHFPRSFGRFEVSALWSGVSPSLSLDINLGVCLVWLAIFLEAWRQGFPSTNTLMSGTGNLPELRMKRGANLSVERIAAGATRCRILTFVARGHRSPLR